jgi:hypothetical protein
MARRCLSETPCTLPYSAERSMYHSHRYLRYLGYMLDFEVMNLFFDVICSVP